jgi:hypothetical protein
MGDQIKETGCAGHATYLGGGSGNLREGDHLKDGGVVGRIILK